MKISPIYPTSKNVLGAIALLLSISLSTTQMVQAQTFTGENQLKKDPTVLPAHIYPTNQAKTIRVNAHNQHRGPLTIVIRDAKGNTKHREVTFVSKYIGLFNLSPLAEGTYTFELSNEAGQTYSRSFRIETSQPRVIALGDPNDKVFDLMSDTVGLINH